MARIGSWESDPGGRESGSSVLVFSSRRVAVLHADAAAAAASIESPSGHLAHQLPSDRPESHSSYEDILGLKIALGLTLHQPVLIISRTSDLTNNAAKNGGL